MTESNTPELIDQMKNLKISEPLIRVLVSDDKFKFLEGEFKEYRVFRDSLCKYIRESRRPFSMVKTTCLRRRNYWEVSIREFAIKIIIPNEMMEEIQERIKTEHPLMMLSLDKRKSILKDFN